MNLQSFKLAATAWEFEAGLLKSITESSYRIEIINKGSKIEKKQ